MPFEIKNAAEEIWFMHQDLEDRSLFFINSEMFDGGFPDSTARIAKELKNPETLKKYVQELAALSYRYNLNHDIMRFKLHTPPKALALVSELQLPRIEYKAAPDYQFKSKRFITEDDKDLAIIRGSNYRGGKFDIVDYFSKSHSIKEKAAFLKEAYGEGGSGALGYDIWHDAKGLRLSIGEKNDAPAKVTMKWNEVAERLTRIIAQGRYISQKDIAEHIRDCKDIIEKKDEDYISEAAVQKARKFLESHGISITETEAEKVSEGAEDDLVTGDKKVSKNAEQGLAADDKKVFENTEEGLESITIDLTPQEEIPNISQVSELTGAKHDFRITDENLGVGGDKTKYKANVTAIRLLNELENENRRATPEEQEILSRYVGWGALAAAFDENNSSWSAEYAELKALLTPEEYDSAKSSTLNAHYTSPIVIETMYEGLKNLGFKSGNILEPAMGVGNFFGMMPEEMSDSRRYGVELDSITGRIAQ